MTTALQNLDVTTLIILITVVISLLAWQNKRLFNALIFYPPAVADGQWYRLLSHGFIHADGTHLLFNMFTLYFFGQEVEKLYLDYTNIYGFVAFYLLAIIAAIIPSYIVNKNNTHYLSLGASGGVVAVLFAYILNYPWETLYIFGIIPIPAILLAVGYVAYSLHAHYKGGSKTNHLAHLWGGVFGLIATIAIEPNVIPLFFKALLSPSF